MTDNILVLQILLFYHYAGACIVITLFSFYEAIFTCEPVAKQKLWFRGNLVFIDPNLPLYLFSKNLQFYLN